VVPTVVEKNQANCGGISNYDITSAVTQDNTTRSWKNIA